MNIKMGYYTISQRTEYSKLQIFHSKTGKNITSTEIGKKILEDYNKQLLHPEKYFNIKGGELLTVLDDIKEDKIRYLFVPRGVSILRSGFASVRNIEFISLPNTVRTVEERAFSGCRDLKYIILPQSVENLGVGCFKWCEALEGIELPNIKEIPRDFFNGCFNLRDIILPDTLTHINKTSFLSCSELRKIIIPDTVCEIGEAAFLGCRTLETVKLPKNLKIIDVGTFCDCESLKEINIPDAVTEIKREAFASTKSLKSVIIPRDLRDIGWQPFLESGIKTLIFNYNLNSINGTDVHGRQANLLESSEIEKLIISNNVKRITSAAFGVDGGKITEIDYLGTKEEFNRFKENNSALFNILPKLRKVNFLEKDLEKSDKNLER